MMSVKNQTRPAWLIFVATAVFCAAFLSTLACQSQGPARIPELAPASLATRQPVKVAEGDRRVLYLLLKLTDKDEKQDERVVAAIADWAGWGTDVAIVVPSWQRFPDAARHRLVRRAVRSCRKNGLRAIWGRWLWVAWPSEGFQAPMPDKDGYLDAEYYATGIAIVTQEARAMGAVAAFLDAEPYARSTVKHIKQARFNADNRFYIDQAIRHALAVTGPVAMIYPTTSARSTHYAWPFADLGLLDWDRTTYYLDDPSDDVVVRPPTGYEHHRGAWLWGSFVTPTSERIGTGDNWTVSIAKAKTFKMADVIKRFPRCKGRFFYLGDGDKLVNTLRKWSKG